MRISLAAALLATTVLSTVAFGQLVPAPPDAFQVRYASNVTVPGWDSYINITDAGTANAGGICVNVYTFAPDEQLVSCCACPVTPNGLASLSVKADLINNTLTPATPTSVVVKLLATQGGSCNAATPTGGNLAAGMRAWGTTIHAANGSFHTTETEFSPAGLSQPELTRITSLCGFIEANGSGFGICNSCRAGGLGGGHK
jgi:hypothetical protein